LASKGQSIFRLEDLIAATHWPRRRAINLLYQLRRSGWIVSLARSTYLIVPLEAGPESAWTEDAVVIACHLASPAAVAYWSACHYWNWTEQVPRTVFVQTTRRVRPRNRNVLGVTYRFVRVLSEKFFGTVERTAGQSKFSVTDREKTLVDALDRPDLCGGIRQVVEMLPAAAEAVRWDKVETYLEKIGSGALYKRLGLLVEMLGEKVKVPDRKRRIEAWRAHLTGGYAPLDPGGPASGPVNSRWRVRVNVSSMAGSAGRP
jgi:predicted transcriptional regulator of viral defense system